MPHVVEWIFSSISLFQSIRKYWILCNPMACSRPGYSVLHYLLELAQIHVHRVSDFIQLPHSLSSPSPLAFNPSQHQSFPMSWLFASRGQNIGASASVLPWIFKVDFPYDWLVWSPFCTRGLSRVFSSTTIQKHQFFSSQPSLGFNSHICTGLLEKTIASTIQIFVSKVMSLLFNTLCVS